MVQRAADLSSSDVPVTPGSGNVFADLGFDEPDLELAKALLSHKISAEIAERKLAESDAAALLGIDRSRVSLLMRGHTGQFSLEQLIGYLERLSFDVRIEAVRSAGDAPGRVTVSA